MKHFAETAQDRLGYYRRIGDTCAIQHNVLSIHIYLFSYSVRLKTKIDVP